MKCLLHRICFFIVTENGFLKSLKVLKVCQMTNCRSSMYETSGSKSLSQVSQQQV